MKAALHVQSDHWLIAGVSLGFVQKMSIMRMIDINAEPILNANRQVFGFKLELVTYFYCLCHWARKSSCRGYESAHTRLWVIPLIG